MSSIILLQVSLTILLVPAALRGNPLAEEVWVPVLAVVVVLLPIVANHSPQHLYHLGVFIGCLFALILLESLYIAVIPHGQNGRNVLFVRLTVDEFYDEYLK